MNINRKFAYNDTLEYSNVLPEGIAETDKNGKKLVYRTVNRNGENILRQGYVCLFLKSEKEAFISLEQDLVEVRTKDGQILCSVNRKEWSEELANIYYDEESYDNTFEYAGKLPEGIVEMDKEGNKLLYRIANRRGENVLMQGYICLFLKSEKEAYINLEQDLVEVRTKDGQILCSVNRKEWNEELANIYYNEESNKEQQENQYRNYIDKFKSCEEIRNECLKNPKKFVDAEIELYCKIHNCSKSEFTNDMKNLIFGWKLYNPGRDYLKCSLDELKYKKEKYLETYIEYLKEDKRVKFIF